MRGEDRDEASFRVKRASIDRAGHLFNIAELTFHEVNLAHENEPDAKVGVLFVDEEESRQENPDAILVLPYRQ
ncbi:unnamed protein product [Vitrella brassicaformis CCMP3155]|uniref:Uncharacterized protein n=1 Tax=Vitrella brassicaformis (strain CCMP3155) TaxID=1169540 RepID=A0A0G4H0Y4_VITBC|nr:unnamed protein product [Vitrella brassicaformis CCMP3155]|eukprot:CEM37024.1 unnamed protein product [Vitrella brassicaformis CCMP3155]